MDTKGEENSSVLDLAFCDTSSYEIKNIDDLNSPNILSSKYYQASFQKFRLSKSSRYGSDIIY